MQLDFDKAKMLHTKSSSSNYNCYFLTLNEDYSVFVESAVVSFPNSDLGYITKNGPIICDYNDDGYEELILQTPKGLYTIDYSYTLTTLVTNELTPFYGQPGLCKVYPGGSDYHYAISSNLDLWDLNLYDLVDNINYSFAGEPEVVIYSPFAPVLSGPYNDESDAVFTTHATSPNIYNPNNRYTKLNSNCLAFW